MFDQIDRAYFEKRALEEIEKAENCVDPSERRERLSKAAEFARKARELEPAIEDDAEIAAP